MKFKRKTRSYDVKTAGKGTNHQSNQREGSPEAGFTGEALPDFSNPLSTGQILSLQRVIGNQALQRAIEEQRVVPLKAHSGILQRDPPPPSPDPNDHSESADLKSMLGTHFIAPGNRFDLDYLPTGGQPVDVRPIAGVAKITLKLHIKFRGFEAVRDKKPYSAIRKFTKKQKDDFNWKPGEEAEFKRNLAPSIQDAWKEKHLLNCTSPGFHALVAKLGVEVVLSDDEAGAHYKVTAQKIPEGLERFRSNVDWDKKEAVLDRLDPTTQRDFGTINSPVKMARIGPFATGSADITPLTGQIDRFITEFDAMEPKGDELLKTHILRAIGRASSSGSEAFNERLAKKRAKAVSEYVGSRAARKIEPFATADGETGTDTSEDFQRVDLNITIKQSVKQMTAAHEAGHMFGLGDEYEEKKIEGASKGRFTGDEVNHAKKTNPAGNDQFGDSLTQGEKDQFVVKDSDSMMSQGMNVAPQHYLPFIKVLERVTNLKWEAK